MSQCEDTVIDWRLTSLRYISNCWELITFRSFSLANMASSSFSIQSGFLSNKVLMYCLRSLGTQVVLQVDLASQFLIFPSDFAILTVSSWVKDAGDFWPDPLRSLLIIGVPEGTSTDEEFCPSVWATCPWFDSWHSHGYLPFASDSTKPLYALSMPHTFLAVSVEKLRINQESLLLNQIRRRYNLEVIRVELTRQ